MNTNLPQSFTVGTDNGDLQVDCMQFYTAYLHCKEAHPEEEPLQNALEHCVGYRFPSVPATVMEGMAQVVLAYEQAREQFAFYSPQDPTQIDLANWHPTEGYVQ